MLASSGIVVLLSPVAVRVLEESWLIEKYKLKPTNNNANTSRDRDFLRFLIVVARLSGSARVVVEEESDIMVCTAHTRGEATFALTQPLLECM